jgi:UPF0755 protein
MKRLLRYVVVAALIVGGYFGFKTYQRVYAPIVKLKGEKTEIFIRSGWTREDVINYLDSIEVIRRPRDLAWVMEKKNYQGNLVVPGKYTLEDKMSGAELVDHLRAGRGEGEVKVIFNSSRTLEDLAGSVAQFIEADSVSILLRLKDEQVATDLGFTPTSFKSMFLPDTYFMEWDTDPDEFISRMAVEYKTFWTGKRKALARELGLSQSEVTTLASIVQAEQQSFPDERRRIAGLYINRLNKGMRLQSDPTVVFALGDFNKQRVLRADLAVDSPYNTYKYAGLPPGPINIPSKQSIDAVLNAEKHKYIYMCAKADFSGYHAFATNLSAHNANARAFQRALNERKIYR